MCYEATHLIMLKIEWLGFLLSDASLFIHSHLFTEQLLWVRICSKCWAIQIVKNKNKNKPFCFHGEHILSECNGIILPDKMHIKVILKKNHDLKKVSGHRWTPKCKDSLFYMWRKNTTWLLLKLLWSQVPIHVYGILGLFSGGGNPEMPPDAIFNQWEMGVCDYPSGEKFQGLFSHSFNLLRNVPFTVLLPTSWFYFHSITIFTGIKSQINLLHSNPYLRFHIWENPN